MIFVTVGTQLGFERLVAACDGWALRSGQRDIFMQIGRSHYRPRHCGWTESLAPSEWQRRMTDAQLVVSHAGMGTVISCMEYGIPLVVMPRRADLGEHRNDHQEATARRLSQLGTVQVVTDETSLRSVLDGHQRGFQAARGCDNPRRQQLIASLRRFVNEPLAGERP